MNEEAQAAQTVVNAGLKTAEMTGRTAVATGKTVVAFVAALIKIKSNQKTAGLTKLKKLQRQGKELTVFQIQESDQKEFRKLSKEYGVLFTAVKNSRTDNGTIEIIAKAEDAALINRTMERLGYPAPAREDAKKNRMTRALSGRESQERGSGLNAGKNSKTNERPSVRQRVEQAKAAITKASGKQKTLEKAGKTR